MRLDLKSQMLFFADQFYLNGESAVFPEADVSALKTLADTRVLAPCNHPEEITRQLFDWYLAGYIHFES
jgi:hypothetical protein